MTVALGVKGGTMSDMPSRFRNYRVYSLGFGIAGRPVPLPDMRTRRQVGGFSALEIVAG
jgi:hypothetical protein